MKFSKSINCDIPSKAAKSNRQKYIGYLWEFEPALSGSANKIVKEQEEPDLLSEQAVTVIQNTLFGKRVSIEEVYSFIPSFPKGVLPVLLAMALAPIRQRVVFYHGKTAETFTPELMERMDESPHEYSIEILALTEGQTTFLFQVENLFQEYIVEQERCLNGYAYLQLAMQRFLITLPQYAQITESVSPTTKRFRKALLNYQYDSAYFLFQLLPTICKNIDEVKACVDELRNIIDVLYDACTNIISEIFPKGISEWLQSLSDFAKKKCYDSGEGAVLGFLPQVQQGNREDVAKLSVLLIGLAPEKFNDETLTLFSGRLLDFRFSAEHPFSEDMFVLCGLHRGKLSRSNIFCTSSIESEYGKMLQNEMKTLLNEYGNSVTAAEKRKVLVKLLTEGGVQ